MFTFLSTLFDPSSMHLMLFVTAKNMCLYVICTVAVEKKDQTSVFLILNLRTERSCNNDVPPKQVARRIMRADWKSSCKVRVHYTIGPTGSPSTCTSTRTKAMMESRQKNSHFFDWRDCACQSRPAQQAHIHTQIFEENRSRKPTRSTSVVGQLLTSTVSRSSKKAGSKFCAFMLLMIIRVAGVVVVVAIKTSIRIHQLHWKAKTNTISIE